MNIGPIETLVLLAVLVVLVVAVATASRRPARDGRGRDVELWAESYGLALTPANRPLVERYVARSTRYRRIGCVLGFLVVPPILVRLDVAMGGWNVVLATAGYALGMVVAELTSPRPEPPERAAGLEARHLEQYLPRQLIWLPRGAVVLLLAALAWSSTIDEAADGEPFAAHAGATGGALAVAAAIAVAILATVELGQRAIVGRRQPASRPDLLAADDALRSQSLHALAAAALCLDALVAFVALQRPALADIANPWFDVLAIVLPMVGWLACLWWTNRAWRVRRDHRIAAPA